MSFHSDGPRVIALGSNTSLQFALEKELSYTPFLSMALIASSSKKLKLLITAIEEKNKQERHALLRSIFDHYRAISLDFFSAAIVQDMAEIYPDAKIILDLNIPESSSTISSRFFSSKLYLLLCYWFPNDRWHYQLRQKVVSTSHGNSASSNGNEDYNYEILGLRRVIEQRGNDTMFLPWRTQDGWDPLCKFLNKPLPVKTLSAPFFTEKDMRILNLILATRGLISWVAVIASVHFARKLIWNRIWRGLFLMRRILFAKHRM